MNYRRIIIGCFVILSAGIAVAAWVSYRQRQHSFFGAVQEDVDGLEQRIRNVESAVGIKRWKFEFHLPPESTLFATFQAQFNGKPVPEMSATYHIVPVWPTEPTTGDVQIDFYAPAFKAKLPQEPKWTLSFSARNERTTLLGSDSRGIGNVYSYVSPFNPSAYSGGQGSGGGDASHSSLDPGREYDVWEYHASGDRSLDGNEQRYDFKYTLTVRMEPLKPDDKSGRVTEIK